MDREDVNVVEHRRDGCGGYEYVNVVGHRRDGYGGCERGGTQKGWMRRTCAWWDTEETRRTRWDTGGHTYLLGSGEGCLLQLVVAVLGIRADGHPWKTERSVVRRALWSCGLRGPLRGDIPCPSWGSPGVGRPLAVVALWRCHLCTIPSVRSDVDVEQREGMAPLWGHPRCSATGTELSVSTRL